jgi:hypothetical protein
VTVYDSDGATIRRDLSRQIQWPPRSRSPKGVMIHVRVPDRTRWDCRND